MKIIFNADDFGLTEGVNLGIIKGFKKGIVKSTTLMVNMGYAKHAVELAKQNPGLGVGVHLTVTAGRPIIEKKTSLLDENNNFYNKDLLYDYTVEFEVEDLYNEWKAQIEKFIEMVGEKPTHLDSHHHIHLIPKYLDVALRLANEYEIPMREQKHTDKKYEYVKLAQTFIGSGCEKEYFLEDRENILGENIVEIMCHPAIVDDELIRISSYNKGRENELEIITSEEIRNWIENNEIEIINFRKIKKI
ncbi:MAG: chitin disaccharide deacetylase [Clostridium sp.]|uniref:chitin disaccharide deacetylase n=1 Tax=Clostridium sp. TaxID=1506 RepID=UPI003F2F2F74